MLSEHNVINLEIKIRKIMGKSPLKTKLYMSNNPWFKNEVSTEIFLIYINWKWNYNTVKFVGHN